MIVSLCRTPGRILPQDLDTGTDFRLIIRDGCETEEACAGQMQ